MAQTRIGTAYLQFQARMGKSWGNIGSKITSSFSNIKSSVTGLLNVFDPVQSKVINLKKAQDKLAKSNTVGANSAESMMISHHKVGNFVSKATGKIKQYTAAEKMSNKSREQSEAQVKKLIGVKTSLNQQAKRAGKLAQSERKRHDRLAKTVGRGAKETRSARKSWESWSSVQKGAQRNIKNVNGKINDQRRSIEKARVASKQSQMQRAQAISSLKEVAGTYGKVIAQRLVLAQVGLGIAAASIAAWGALALAAGQLNWQMAEVATVMNRAALPALESLETTVIKVSNEFGYASGVASKALYQILSAQVDVASASYVLEISAKAARAGFVQMSTAADAITTILNAYQKSASDAKDVSDLLFMTVRMGKTTFRELAAQIGRVAAQGSLANIAMEDLFSSIAVMTQAGIKSSVSMTSLTAMLRNVLSPSAEGAAMAVNQFGISLGSAGLEARGLIGIMRALSGATAEQIRAIFSSQRAFRGASALIENITGLMKTYQSMVRSTGTTEEALAQVSDKLTLQLKRLWQSIKSVTAALGEAMDAHSDLASIASRLVESLSSMAEWISEVRNEWIGTIGKGVILAGVLIGLIVALTGIVWAGAAVVSAIGMLSAAIVAIVAVIGPTIAAVVGLTAGIIALGAAGSATFMLLGKAAETEVDRINDSIKVYNDLIHTRKEEINQLDRTLKELGDLYKQRKKLKGSIEKEINATRSTKKRQDALSMARRLGIDINKDLVRSEDGIRIAREKLEEPDRKLLDYQKKMAQETARRLKRKAIEAKKNLKLGESNRFVSDSIRDLGTSFGDPNKEAEVLRKELSKLRGEGPRVRRALEDLFISSGISRFTNQFPEVQSKLEDMQQMLLRARGMEGPGQLEYIQAHKDAINDLLKWISKKTHRKTWLPSTAGTTILPEDEVNRAKSLSQEFSELITYLEAMQKGEGKLSALGLEYLKVQRAIQRATEGLGEEVERNAERAEANIESIRDMARGLAKDTKDLTSAEWEGYLAKIKQTPKLLDVTKRALEKELEKTDNLSAAREDELQKGIERIDQIKEQAGHLRSTLETLRGIDDKDSDIAKKVRAELLDYLDITKALEFANIELIRTKRILGQIEARSSGWSGIYEGLNSLIEHQVGLAGDQQDRLKAVNDYYNDISNTSTKIEKLTQQIAKAETKNTKKSRIQASLKKKQKSILVKVLKQQRSITAEEAAALSIEKDRQAVKFGGRAWEGFKAFKAGAVEVGFESKPEEATARNTAKMAKLMEMLKNMWEGRDDIGKTVSDVTNMVLKSVSKATSRQAKSADLGAVKPLETKPVEVEVKPESRKKIEDEAKSQLKTNLDLLKEWKQQLRDAQATASKGRVSFLKDAVDGLRMRMEYNMRMRAESTKTSEKMKSQQAKMAKLTKLRVYLRKQLASLQSKSGDLQGEEAKKVETTIARIRKVLKGLQNVGKEDWLNIQGAEKFSTRLDMLKKAMKVDLGKWFGNWLKNLAPEGKAETDKSQKETAKNTGSIDSKMDRQTKVLSSIDKSISTFGQQPATFA